jgi:hypothetical protein
MVEADRRSFDGWADLIVRGQEEGSIRADVKPRAAAVVLLGLLRGVAAVLLTDAAVGDLDEVRQTCHKWITAALAVSGSAKGRSRSPRGRRPAARAS